MQSVSIVRILDKILNHPEIPLDDIVNQHFSPEYRQRTNGHWDNRTEFVQHLQKLRELVASVDITLLEEVQQGNRYADRHLVDAVKKDGSRTRQEVYVFAELDEAGRFIRVEETTLLLEGSEADKNLGSIK